MTKTIYNVRGEGKVLTLIFYKWMVCVDKEIQRVRKHWKAT